MLREQLVDFQYKISQGNLSSLEMMKYQQQMQETQKAIFMQNQMRKERYIAAQASQTFKGRMHCFSMQVVMNKYFLLNPERKKI